MGENRQRLRWVAAPAGAAAIAIAALLWLGLSADYPAEYDEDFTPAIRYDTDSVESRVRSAVDEAISLYDSRGGDAFGMITPEAPTYTHDIYQFVLDSATLETVADGAFPDLVGTVPVILQTGDRPLDQILADLERDGGTWVEYMFTNPDTGTVQLKRTWLFEHDGYIFGSGHYLFDTGVQDLVDDAVRLYESEGGDAFGMITPETEITTGILYPFAINGTTYQTVAHGATPAMVGTCCSDAIRTTGDRPFEEILADLDEHGGTWVEYPFTNPDTGTVQLKRTWLFEHDGFIFGAGYYLPDSRVQSVVAATIHLYDSSTGDAFGMITPEERANLSKLYPFVLDAATLETVAHGAFPHLVGKASGYLEAADAPLDKILSDLGGGEGAWVAYISTNPDTGTEQLTRAWLLEHDGYIFGAGYYLPDSTAQSMVDEAISFYKSNGEDGFEIITSGIINIGDIYPFVMGPGAAVTMAHGADSKWVGIPPPHLPGSRSLAETMEVALLEGGGARTEYVFTNPHTGTEQVKRSWMALHDGFGFGAGYYLPDAEAQSVVDYALFIYESDPESAFERITPDEPITTDRLYPFVLNATTLATVAHGVTPDLVGGCCSDEIRTTGDRQLEEILADIAEHGNAWVTYVFPNPDTGTDQLKRVWLLERDGFIFGAGYYILDSQVQAITRVGIAAYDTDGEAAFAGIGTPPPEPDPLYTFVVDPETAEVLAQGADPALVGPSSDWQAITATGTVPDILAELETEPGAWVEYPFTNPETGAEETKRTWLVIRDGLVFGTGYYASNALG